MSERYKQPTDQMWAREVGERLRRLEKRGGSEDWNFNYINGLHKRIEQLEVRADEIAAVLSRLFMGETPVDDMKHIAGRFLGKLKYLSQGADDE